MDYSEKHRQLFARHQLERDDQGYFWLVDKLGERLLGFRAPSTEAAVAKALEVTYVFDARDNITAIIL